MMPGLRLPVLTVLPTPQGPGARGQAGTQSCCCRATHTQSTQAGGGLLHAPPLDIWDMEANETLHLCS